SSALLLPNRVLFLLFLMIQPQPRSTLLPYTTLFRSAQTVLGLTALADNPQASSRALAQATLLAIKIKKIQNDLLIVESNQRELRSEEYTSELQSRGHLVCRRLLEKKKNGLTLA